MIFTLPLSGHSYGQCGFYLPAENLLIGGDVMMSMPWGLTYPIRAASPDWDSVKLSVNKVAELNPNILCLGHGTVVQGNIAQKISRRLSS